MKGFAAIAAVLLFTVPTGTASAVTQGDGWIWWYQQVTPQNAHIFHNVRAAVVTTQNDQAGAAALIHREGAQAYEYLNVYWLPLGQTYDGIDLAAHPEWQFCGAGGSAPDVGRTAGGVQWAYPDLNDQGMHDAIIGYLQSIKAAGFDGVFFDRGTVALSRGAMPAEVSTCTTDPVTPGASYGAAYQRIILDAKALGLRVVVNYGGGGAPLAAPIRKIATRILQETAPRRSSTGAVAAFARRKAEDHAAQGHSQPRFAEEIKTQGVDRAEAYFEWAEAAQWRITLTVNSGNSGCVGVAGVCWHYGVYPELARVDRGRGLNAKPRPLDCVSGVKCLWVRKWQGAMVVVNETRHAITETLKLHQTSCRVVTNAWRGRVMRGGRCVRRVTVTVPGLSGRVYSEAKP
jgi:hypothetical protein